MQQQRHAMQQQPRLVRSAVVSKLAYRDRGGGGAGHARPVVWRASDGELVVGFRGSVDLRDVSIALDCRRVPLRLGDGRVVCVHAGVLRAYEEARRGVALAALLEDDAERPPRRVTFVGHSLGGAVAMLAAVLHASRVQPQQRHTTTTACHAFGAFRVGDSDFCGAYDTLVLDSVVAVHRADPVAALPPTQWGYGDVSRGRTVFASRDPPYACTAARPPEQPGTQPYACTAASPGTQPYACLDAHRMDSYLAWATAASEANVA
jgi:pimeloyl-ACP methyl ester carboxylesterase